MTAKYTRVSKVVGSLVDAIKGLGAISTIKETKVISDGESEQFYVGYNQAIEDTLELCMHVLEVK